MAMHNSIYLALFTISRISPIGSNANTSPTLDGVGPSSSPTIKTVNHAVLYSSAVKQTFSPTHLQSISPVSLSHAYAPSPDHSVTLTLIKTLQEQVSKLQLAQQVQLDHMSAQQEAQAVLLKKVEATGMEETSQALHAQQDVAMSLAKANSQAIVALQTDSNALKDTLKRLSADLQSLTAEVASTMRRSFTAHAEEAVKFINRHELKHVDHYQEIDSVDRSLSHLSGRLAVLECSQAITKTLAAATSVAKGIVSAPVSLLGTKGNDPIQPKEASL